MQIEYYKKHIYGLPSLFIKDEKIARQVTKLTGRKTITDTDMAIMSELFKAEFIQVIN